MRTRYFFAVALSIVLVILFAVHVIVYSAVITLFDISNSSLLLSIKIIFIILWLSYIISSVVVFRFNTILSRLMYRISSVWLGSLLYLFIASFFTIIIAALPGVDIFVSIITGKILFSLAILISMYGVIHARNIQIMNVQVALKNLPENWKGKKAVWVSDLHLGQVQTHAFAERVVQKINKLNPDIVLIGGDMYDGVAVDAEKVVESFLTIKAPYGSYFVMGNHEEFRDNARYKAALEKAGIRVLDNKKVDLDGLQLIGVDYHDTLVVEEYKNILENLHINTAQPSILMRHVPTKFDIPEHVGISLQISGHTHKAQVFPFTLVSYAIYKEYEYGLHPYKNMQVYTSSGVGTWGPPLRIGTTSEIVVFEFV